MKTVKIEVDDLIYEFYQKVGWQAGLPAEQVMSDVLFKFAGEMATEMQKKEGKIKRTPLDIP